MSRKIATRKRPNRPVEGGQAAGVLFKWEEGGEDWAGVFIDGDVEGLDAAAGGGDGSGRRWRGRRVVGTDQFLDAEVEEVARAARS